MEWSDFIVKDFSFVEFAPGSRVVDVGCGDGDQLEDLRRAGLDPVGIERSQPLVDGVIARGLPVLRGVAERLPLRSHSADGVICKVVVPYTDERRAIGIRGARFLDDACDEFRDGAHSWTVAPARTPPAQEAFALTPPARAAV